MSGELARDVLYLIKAARELSKSLRPMKADPDGKRRIAETLEREYGVRWSGE